MCLKYFIAEIPERVKLRNWGREMPLPQNLLKAGLSQR